LFKRSKPMTISNSIIYRSQLQNPFQKLRLIGPRYFRGNT
jgi:hypothetical protein